MKMYFWFVVVLVVVVGVIFAYKNNFDPDLVRQKITTMVAELKNDAGTKDEELGQAFGALFGEVKKTQEKLNKMPAGEGQKWKTELDALLQEMKNKKGDFEKIKNDIGERVSDAKQGYENADAALKNFREAFASIKNGMNGANLAIDGFRKMIAE